MEPDPEGREDAASARVLATRLSDLQWSPTQKAGKTRCDRSRPRSRTSLQWSPTQKAGKTRSHAPSARHTTGLQWSPTQKAGKTRVDRAMMAADTTPSMEPDPEGREDQDDVGNARRFAHSFNGARPRRPGRHCGSHPRGVAGASFNGARPRRPGRPGSQDSVLPKHSPSMEPDPEGREDESEPPRTPRSLSPLQWSPTQKAGKTRHLLTPASRVPSPSMEPDPEGREDRSAAGCIWPWWSLQWSPTQKAGKTPTLHSFHTASHGLQWSPTQKAGKTRLPLAGSTRPLPSFNGARPRRPGRR